MEPNNYGLYVFGFLGVSVLPFIYIFIIRDYILKKVFQRQLGCKDTFVQWFQEDGPFPYSKYMEQDTGNIIIGSNNVALYKSLMVGELKFVRYCVVLLNTEIKSGLYGKGHIVRACSPMELFPNSYPILEVKELYSSVHAPECVEISNGRAYLYFPLNNWFGSKGITDAIHCANCV